MEIKLEKQSLCLDKMGGKLLLIVSAVAKYLVNPDSTILITSEEINIVISVTYSFRLGECVGVFIYEKILLYLPVQDNSNTTNLSKFIGVNRLLGNNWQINSYNLTPTHSTLPMVKTINQLIYVFKKTISSSL